MACRVRVRLRRGLRSVETSALVNSGFESDEPDVVVPVEGARALGLWPPPDDVELAELGTGGGDLAAPYYRKAAKLELLAEGVSKSLEVCIIVDPYVDEVILSDAVAGELGISILDVKRGLWRPREDPAGVERESAEKEVWK